MPLTKEVKRLQRKMHDEAQSAYIKMGLARYEEELSHVVNDVEALALKERWTKVAELLNDGWVIDFESVDIFKGIG